jgi:hypothetical protein
MIEMTQLTQWIELGAPNMTYNIYIFAAVFIAARRYVACSQRYALHSLVDIAAPFETRCCDGSGNCWRQSGTAPHQGRGINCCIPPFIASTCVLPSPRPLGAEVSSLGVAARN